MIRLPREPFDTTVDQPDPRGVVRNDDIPHEGIADVDRFRAIQIRRTDERSVCGEGGGVYVERGPGRNKVSQ